MGNPSEAAYIYIAWSSQNPGNLHLRKVSKTPKKGDKFSIGNASEIWTNPWFSGDIFRSFSGGVSDPCPTQPIHVWYIYPLIYP